MKAILKTIWFALAVVLHEYVTKPISPFADKLNTYTPTFLENMIDFNNFANSAFIHQLTFIVLLFLGLDVISGDIKGLISGPIKLAFNAVLYMVGFTVVFFLLNNFLISF